MAVHAYRDAPAPGTVSVSGEVLRVERLQVCVSDEGAGMTPRSDSPGLGLGLPLIAQVADPVDIEPGPHGGTRVTMGFALLSGR